jgi:VCBS repeat-containing protein
MKDNITSNRRKVLAVSGATVLTSLSGCATIKSEILGRRDIDPDNPCDPVIESANTEVQNFRQTREPSTTYALIQNNGGLGELEIKIEAKGTTAVYDSQSQLFSLEANQSVQTRFELQTHEGADEIRIRIECTDDRSNYDTLVISENENSDMIDYSVNS